jgi:diphosphomevalonate decarboxylase
LALNQAFGLDLPKPTLSMFARIGSGSASRSLWHGFVQWDRGEREDGSDSIAHPIDLKWPEFRIAIINVASTPKSVSSRDGMNHTVDTSPLFRAWPEQAEMDCKNIRSAIERFDFEQLGEIAEANALAMHATMMAARPAIQYLAPESFAILDEVRQLRANGTPVYATMDAGPNVKLIFTQDATKSVANVFPHAQIIEPFAPLN